MLDDPVAPGRDYAFAEHNWHDYMAFERAVRDPRYTYIRNGRPDLPGTPPADAVRSPTFAAMKRLEAAGRLTAAQRDSFIVPRPTEELYDNLADPDSLRNFAADPAQAAVLARLRGALDRWTWATDGHMPAQLSPDGFDRVTGLRLPGTARPNQP